MKINTAQPIIGWDWEPVKDRPDGEELTVRWAIQMICNGLVQAEPLTHESVVTAGTLAKRAYEPAPDYSDADRQFILHRSELLIAERMNTVIVHQFLNDLFDSSLALVAQLPEQSNDDLSAAANDV